jgi:hypothetical protein
MPASPKKHGNPRSPAMTASEDRYVYPAEGADPREVDREYVDPEQAAARQKDRAVSHPQETERAQGTSADSPGFDPADRERADDAAAPGEEGEDVTG